MDVDPAFTRFYTPTFFLPHSEPCGFDGGCRFYVNFLTRFGVAREVKVRQSGPK